MEQLCAPGDDDVQSNIYKSVARQPRRFTKYATYYFTEADGGAAGMATPDSYTVQNNIGITNYKLKIVLARMGLRRSTK